MLSGAINVPPLGMTSKTRPAATPAISCVSCATRCPQVRPNGSELRDWIEARRSLGAFELVLQREEIEVAP